MAALAALALAACDPYVQGNGVYLEEPRAVPSFVGLHVEDGIEAVVTAHAAGQSVVVSGDANLVPWIETEVQTDAVYGPVLHVWISEDFSRTIPPRAVIQVPDIAYVFAKQGAKVKVTGAATPLFTVDGREGSEIELIGPGGLGGNVPAGLTLDVTLASGSLLEAEWYVVTESATVEISGASVARIHSNGSVTGSVAGGSELDNRLGSGDCSGVTADGSIIRC